MRSLKEQGIAKEIVAERLRGLKEDPGHPLWKRGLLPKKALPRLPEITGLKVIVNGKSEIPAERQVEASVMFQ